jgi:hypothetical protein
MANKEICSGTLQQTGFKHYSCHQRGCHHGKGLPLTDCGTPQSSRQMDTNSSISAISRRLANLLLWTAQLFRSRVDNKMTQKLQGWRAHFLRGDVAVIGAKDTLCH